jgi:hypothetical protein
MAVPDFTHHEGSPRPCLRKSPCIVKRVNQDNLRNDRVRLEKAQSVDAARKRYLTRDVVEVLQL